MKHFCLGHREVIFEVAGFCQTIAVLENTITISIIAT